MVFPYMDHDLAGLLENERVKLQPSQIKLYMKQLLEGTSYMHRVRPIFFSDTPPLTLLTEPHSAPRYEGRKPAHL
jgi:serine/threonine protein kinase